MNARADVVATARAMGDRGINAGTAGNVSIRTEGGMLITPSGVDYATMGEADVVEMSSDTTWRAPGGLRPSSEWRFHLDVYAARPDAGAIVHAHPTNSTALSVHGRGIGPFHYMVAVAGGHDIRCCPYATFGTQELSDHVVAALADRRAALMEHHGLVAIGATAAEALALAVEVEVLATQYIAALVIGEPPELTAAQMDDVLAKMASDGYGSSRD